MPETGSSASKGAVPGICSVLAGRWPNVLAGCMIALAALAAYHNSFSKPFIFDDIPVIVENASIRHLWPIGDALSPPRASGMTASGRPLVNLSFAVNYALGGTAVWGYHAVNLVIHILAGLTLFGIVRRTLLLPKLRDRFGAAAWQLATAVAVIWTVHPLQTESVTYVTQRTESLMGLFYLLTLYCFIRGNGSAKSGAWYSLCVVACLLGMATKEVMVSAPILIFLYDRTFVEGTFANAWKRHGRLYIGLAGTWFMLGYLVLATGNRAGTAGLGTHVHTWQYVLTQCWAITQYLKLSVWPHPLVFDYGMWLANDVVNVAPRAMILAALILAVVIGLRWSPVLGFLGAWFLLILAPTSSVVPVVSQTVAEHRMYLPLAAVVASVVTGFYAWMGRRSVLLFIPFAVVLGVLTAQRNTDYRSLLSIWHDTAAKRPGSLRAHYSYGFALEQTGQIEEAIKQYEQVVQLDPDYAEAHDRLGNDLMQVGRSSEAMEHFEQALRIKPEYAKAHNDIGVALERTGRLPQAILHYEQAVRLKPDYPEAYNNLGIALTKSGRVQEAIASYEQALRIKPDFAEAHNSLGSAFLGLGKIQQAIEQYEQALSFRPDYATAHYNLGSALEAAGRASEAVSQYQQALRLKPDFVEAQKKLAQLRSVP
jgi:protein O-mannosyl-transferase